jgi:hypothetical protein
MSRCQFCRVLGISGHDASAKRAGAERTLSDPETARHNHTHSSASRELIEIAAANSCHACPREVLKP